MNKEKDNIKNITHNSKHKQSIEKITWQIIFENNHFQIKEVVRNCLLKQCI